MNQSEIEKVRSDVLIIGAGAAGCAAAIQGSEYSSDVVLLAKGAFGHCGTTNLAGVVYSAALRHTDQKDSMEAHFRDTIVEGRYLGDQKLVKILTEEAPRTVYDLERYGVPWYKRGPKLRDPAAYDYYQAPSPGHSFDRGVHYDQKTGKVVQRALVQEVKKHNRIRILDDTYIFTLLIEGTRIKGALGLSLKTGKLIVFESKTVILATGGAGCCYKITDMDRGATGDGYGLALEVGAELLNMEMTQFFPTAFVHPESLRGRSVSSSSLWKLGLKLYNAQMKRFMLEVSPIHGENETRDVLSRAIFQEIIQGRGTEHGGVWIDTRDIPNWEQIKKDRPRAYLWPERFGVNTTFFEVAPSYHFTIGGIKIDERCETSIAGLFAAGEVAGGIHGANRLAGNALAECMVFGQIAGREAALQARSLGDLGIKNNEAIERWNQIAFPPRAQSRELSFRPIHLRKKLGEAMYRDVGIVRSEQYLKRALREVENLEETALSKMEFTPGHIYNYDLIEAFELRKMLLVSKATILSALKRKESRGAHYRNDYPKADNREWLKNIITKFQGDQISLSHEEIKLDRLKPEDMDA